MTARATGDRHGHVVAAASLLAALLSATLPLHAAEADDHQRGLAAYHRGDVVAALSALRPAARAGHAPSQTLLAFLLERADLVDEAAVLYAAAAAQGHADAHAALAQLRLDGRGVAKDEKQALVHFSEAAAAGHAGAAEWIAVAWIERRAGLDPAADPAGAAMALRRAAERGHRRSIERLARPTGEPFAAAVGDEESRRWQRVLAEQPVVATPAPGARRRP